jgi:hypothetical protein
VNIIIFAVIRKLIIPQRYPGWQIKPVQEPVEIKHISTKLLKQSKILSSINPTLLMDQKAGKIGVRLVLNIYENMEMS